MLDGDDATALHLRRRQRGSPTDAGAVKVAILGPRRRSRRRSPQVAAELVAHDAARRVGLWVDGIELLEKGGGLTPNRGTIYGAPGTPLAQGKHVAVAYGRTAEHATAVALVVPRAC